MALILKQGHNQKGYFEKHEAWSQYDEIIDLVVKSQFFTSLTIDPPIHTETLNELWANAETVTVNDQVISLNSTIQGRRMAITPETLGIRLGLDDVGAPDQFPNSEIHMTMTECGYQGTLSHATIFNKFFEPKYKLLFHYIIMCLSPKTGSYDQMPSTFQPIFHSIVNETKFRASKLFFNELVLHHLNSKKKFLLYPRFIMHYIIKELGEEVLVGKTTILNPLSSQAYSRHNKPAAWPEDDQGEQEPVPMEPSSSKPTPPKAKKPKQQKQKPTNPKRKAVQEVEMPELANVQSALDKDVTETSSQSHPPQTPPRAPIKILFKRKKFKKTIPIDPSFETAEPIDQTTEPAPQTSEPEIEIGKLLSGLKKRITSEHVSPQQP